MPTQNEKISALTLEKVAELTQENLRSQLIKEGIVRVIQAAQKELLLMNEVLNTTSAEIARLKAIQEKPAEVPEIMPDNESKKDESKQQM